MIDLDEDEVPPKRDLLERCLPVVWTATRLTPTIISIGCAVAAGYFSHAILNAKPPPDMSKLAISILRSSDVSPELRDWATSVLKIPTDISLAR